MVCISELQSYPVLVAGTFGPLHDGHRELLDTALGHGDTIVGLTSDDLARETRSEPRYVPSFISRRAQLRDELAYLSRKHDSAFTLLKIDDPIALATELPNIKTLVITPKENALDRAHEINDVRQNKGLDPLDIHKSDIVTADDNIPISSTRIINLEIDEHGAIRE